MREEWIRGHVPIEANRRERRREVDVGVRSESDSNRLRAELEFGLALSTFLGGLWYLGFGVIERLTLNSPAEPMLMFYGFSHGIIFMLFVYSLVLLFDMGLSLVDEGKLPSMAYKVFLYVWPCSLGFIAVSFVLNRSQKMKQDDPLQLLVFIVVATLVGIACYGLAKRRSIVWHTAYAFGLVVCSTMIYVVVMAAILPDVHIQTDKEIYKLNEQILVKVRTNGYVFNPSITRVEVAGQGDLELGGALGNGVTFSYAYEQWTSDDPYIIVWYKPQLGFSERKKFHRVPLATFKPSS